MMTMPKCHDCGRFCRPVAWKMIYSGALPEPQEEIYRCAPCVEKHGLFEPQHGIKPEYSCGKFPAVPPEPTFADGMTKEDDRRFLELTNDLTHNALGEGRERGILREASSGEAATSTDGLGVAVPSAPPFGKD